MTGNPEIQKAIKGKSSNQAHSIMSISDNLKIPLICSQCLSQI